MTRAVSRTPVFLTGDHFEGMRTSVGYYELRPTPIFERTLRGRIMVLASSKARPTWLGDG